MIRFGHRADPPSWPRPGEIALAATDLAVGIHGRPVLTGVDIAVAAGETVALVGPNGAGKSTLLAALAGDRAAESGRVEVLGRELASWSGHALARCRAVMPQSFSVSFGFSCAEVVALGRAPWAGTRESENDESAVRAAMIATGIADLADRPVDSLSGGERARVSLARVLAQQTPILMLDEPTAALDLRHQELALTLARQRAAAGCAVLIVLHDLSLAAAYADRIGVLAGGRVVADGRPATVLTAELLSEVYDQPVRVLDDPEGGAPIVVPRRAPADREPVGSLEPSGALGIAQH